MTTGIFMAVGFAGEFEMWGPDRLTEETLAVRLGSKLWNQVLTPDDPRHEAIDAIFEDTKEMVMEALVSKALIAYVHKIDTGLFYVIPAEVWGNEQAHDYLDGRLFRGVFSGPRDHTIPSELLDLPIMLERRAAQDWLKGATVAALSATLPPPVPGGALDRWVATLSEEQLGLKNADYVLLARAKFPDLHVGRDRALDARREIRGHGVGGRPKTNDD